MSTKQRTPGGEFEFVYSTSKNPTSLHALVDGKECWAGHMRSATPDELKRLRPEPICKHCAARLARATAAAAPQPTRAPTTRQKATKAGADHGDRVVLVDGVKVAETRQVTL